METEAIKKAVRRKGGVRKVAAALGVSRNCIYYYCAGRREPSPQFLEYIELKKIERFVRA